MSSSHSHDFTVPRLPLAGMGLLVVVSLLAVLAYRQWGDGRSNAAATAPVVAERLLRFDDQPGGGITVRNAADGSTLRDIAPGADPFVRGALRALVRERRSSGIGADAPFHLVARANGRLTLQDPSTGRRLDIESFGVAQASSFARLLDAPSR